MKLEDLPDLYKAPTSEFLDFAARFQASIPKEDVMSGWDILASAKSAIKPGPKPENEGTLRFGPLSKEVLGYKGDLQTPDSVLNVLALSAVFHETSATAYHSASLNRTKGAVWSCREAITLLRKSTKLPGKHTFWRNPEFDSSDKLVPKEEAKFRPDVMGALVKRMDLPPGLIQAVRMHWREASDQEVWVRAKELGVDIAKVIKMAETEAKEAEAAAKEKLEAEKLEEARAKKKYEAEETPPERPVAVKMDGSLSYGKAPEGGAKFTWTGTLATEEAKAIIRLFEGQANVGWTISTASDGDSNLTVSGPGDLLKQMVRLGKVRLIHNGKPVGIVGFKTTQVPGRAIPGEEEDVLTEPQQLSLPAAAFKARVLARKLSSEDLDKWLSHITDGGSLDAESPFTLRKMAVALGLHTPGWSQLSLSLRRSIIMKGLRQRQAAAAMAGTVVEVPEAFLKNPPPVELMATLSDPLLEAMARKFGVWEQSTWLQMSRKDKAAMVAWAQDCAEFEKEEKELEASDSGVEKEKDGKSIMSGLKATLSSAATTIQNDGQDAAWRTAAKQLVKLTKEPLVALLQRHLGPNDESVRKKIADFLDTEMGTIFVEGMMATMMTTGSMIPGIPPGMAPKVSRLAQELRVKALADGMDMSADVFMAPLRAVISMYLQGVPDVDSGFLESTAEPPKALASGPVSTQTADFQEIGVTVKLPFSVSSVETTEPW